MPARVRKIRHDEETRAKIQAAAIINRFQKCIDGEVELSAQQVSCGKTLLDKALPNLQAVELDAEHKHDVSDPLKDLLEAIANRGKRLAES
ncbi:MAG: hypothetical protein JJ864_08560 [Rhizobiaceae bacterium]|nr:hypothetical protein [Rhizobiaceae bacterium]